jgi:hypothetical protein
MVKIFSFNKFESMMFFESFFFCKFLNCLSFVTCSVFHASSLLFCPVRRFWDCKTHNDDVFLDTLGTFQNGILENTLYGTFREIYFHKNWQIFHILYKIMTHSD